MRGLKRQKPSMEQPDSRGAIMKDLISSHGFNIVNRPRDVLDFIPGGTSFVDITLTGGQVNVTRWLFLSMPFLSDHPYIYFEVKMCALPPLPRKVAPSLAGLDKITFSAKVKQRMSNWHLPPSSFCTPCQRNKIKSG